MFFIFYIIINIVVITHQVHKVKVSIFYESLCPHCINFMTKNFYPHYKDLKDYIRVEWIPYGKASQSKSGSNWTFSCGHGKDECKTNKFQACALDQGEVQEKNAEFINCILSSSYPAHTPILEDCAQSNSFDWDGILNCFDNGRGDDLLARMGRITNNLRPDLKHFPAVIYNDRFDKILCDIALKDFVNATCSVIPNPKPEICSEEKTEVESLES